mmetsp:Transcript_13339/g.15293  ORF Transcript_13339/g.15293 Transcript_13339/m.15293 type:complete len:99 (+) Transcript_13339:366-662(+)
MMMSRRHKTKTRQPKIESTTQIKNKKDNQPKTQKQKKLTTEKTKKRWRRANNTKIKTKKTSRQHKKRGRRDNKHIQKYIKNEDKTTNTHIKETILLEW